MKKAPLLIGFGLILIHLFLLLNLRFEAWPEILVYPYLLKKGFLLYRDIINPYVPLFTGFLYLFFSLFDLTVKNLQLLTWCIILLVDILIYYLAFKRYGKTPAILALTFFVVFQPLLDGNGLWYDLALVPILLLAFHYRSPFLLSLAFFIKQSVVWLFLIFYKRWRKLTVFLICLFFVTAAFFALQQNLTDYLFWAWQFPFTIFPHMPGHKDLSDLRHWGLALFPFILPSLLYLLSYLKKSFPLKLDHPFFWMLFSLSLILPRFGLFHLQPALSFAALSLAHSTSKLRLQKLFSHPFIKLLAVAYGLCAIFLWSRHFKLYWHKPPRFFEPDIIAAAQNLQTSTSADQPILFLNAPDQLMVLANRLPAKPWAITFPWYLELPGMQQRIIASLKNQPAPAVVFSPYQKASQFTPGSYAPQEIDQFVHKHFPSVTMLSGSIKLLSN